MTPRLVLSLFPGGGLLDKAFEDAGFTVVRGPDAIWGGDIHTFHVPAGRFDGVIGGPPCQFASTASAISGTQAVNLIPEFVRVVGEAAPQWVVMENVPPAIVKARDDVPAAWFPAILRDWDCGGETHRRRAFWTWPLALMAPPRLPGKPSPSVMATTFKRGSSDFVDAKGYLAGNLPLAEYGRLQGAPEVVEALEKHGAGREFIVRLLGNGVPRAVGRYVAGQIRVGMYGDTL